MAEGTNQTTTIGADTSITGEISFESAAQVYGRVEGKIVGKGELRIGSGATCRAAIDAGRVTVDGTVEGDVVGRDRVELTAKARVTGDVTAPKLVVNEGASFYGHCRVGPDAGKEHAKSVAEAKPAAKGVGAPTA